MREIRDIERIHDILFGALCYFDCFCRVHGLTYFLSNGTLLGSVKYGDFIPWDDDVDVLMPRESYNALVSAPNINSNDYRLLCKEKVNTWRMPYAKLSCEQTVVDEGGYEFGADFGLNIDIFPIDNWHPCVAVAKMQSLRSELLKRMLVAANSSGFVTQKTGIKRAILYVWWSIGQKRGYKKLNQSFEKITNNAKRYRSVNVGCVVWTCHMVHEVFPKEMFEETVFLEFRGRDFPTFGGYTRYLDSIYGNWREELPLDRQHSNHTLKVWYKNAQEFV